MIPPSGATEKRVVLTANGSAHANHVMSSAAKESLRASSHYYTSVI